MLDEWGAECEPHTDKEGYVAVVGCRDADRDTVLCQLEHLDTDFPGFWQDRGIVTGDATGADQWAREFAHMMEIPLVVYGADWDKHGKTAGPIRNTDIVNKCRMLIAFWDGQSKGTLDSITKAVKAGKYVEILSLVKGKS